MHIAAVTVCINYSRDLAYCVGNRKLLDQWLIVTSADDNDTIRLCEEHNIDYIFSQRINEQGAPFAKGKAINEGFTALSQQNQQDWLLMIDGDMILPANFRQIIEKIPATPTYKQCLFGPKLRRMVNTEPSEYNRYCTLNIEHLQRMYDIYYADFAHNIENIIPPSFQQYDDFFTKINNEELLETLIPSVEQQWQDFHKGQWQKLPINFEGHQQHLLGYFQLFHSDYFQGYPEHSPDSQWDDVIFRNSYPYDQRIILDFECVHVGKNSSAENREQEKAIQTLEPPNVPRHLLAGDPWFNHLADDAYTIF